jgi:hypothetical protein
VKEHIMRKLVISSDMFTWDKMERKFVAESSCLEAHMDRLGHDRLNYVNSEWGFHMQSVRTGTEIWFRRDREQRGYNRELQAVIFTAQALPGVQVVVFND